MKPVHLALRQSQTTPEKPSSATFAACPPGTGVPFAPPEEGVEPHDQHCTLLRPQAQVGALNVGRIRHGPKQLITCTVSQYRLPDSCKGPHGACGTIARWKKEQLLGQPGACHRSEHHIRSQNLVHALRAQSSGVEMSPAAPPDGELVEWDSPEPQSGKPFLGAWS